NDLLALGCSVVLLELGLRVPEDIAVSGFNDMPFMDKLRPPLTTLRIPHYKMGAQAARTLLARLSNPKAPIEHIRFKPELVVRGSTAPRKARAPLTALRHHTSYSATPTPPAPAPPSHTPPSP